MNFLKIETLLPLGKLDPGLRSAKERITARDFFDQARLVEELGYDAIAVTETKLDPFVQLAIVSEATERIELHSAVAIAFARSPTVMAQAAWTLQDLSRGRFNLGLGTQVRAHMERRFGVPWRPPGPWLHDYVLAMREVWKSWQEGRQPKYEGAVYSISLMVPLFDPGPLDMPKIPVTIAAVKPVLCRVAGEVANGLRPHPICTPNYIKEVMKPAVLEGTRSSRRSVDDVEIMVSPLVATAQNEESLVARTEEVRARVAFYASTPAYRPVFDFHGMTDLAIELAQLSRAQRWSEMPRLINDDVLRTYACVGTYREIADIVKSRYRELVSSTEFSIPVRSARDKETLGVLLADLRN